MGKGASEACCVSPRQAWLGRSWLPPCPGFRALTPSPAPKSQPSGALLEPKREPSPAAVVPPKPGPPRTNQGAFVPLEPAGQGWELRGGVVPEGHGGSRAWILPRLQPHPRQLRFLTTRMKMGRWWPGPQCQTQASSGQRLGVRTWSECQADGSTSWKEARAQWSCPGGPGGQRGWPAVSACGDAGPGRQLADRRGQQGGGLGQAGAGPPPARPSGFPPMALGLRHPQGRSRARTSGLGAQALSILSGNSLQGGCGLFAQCPAERRGPTSVGTAEWAAGSGVGRWAAVPAVALELPPGHLFSPSHGSVLPVGPTPQEGELGILLRGGHRHPHPRATSARGVGGPGGRAGCRPQGGAACARNARSVSAASTAGAWRPSSPWSVGRPVGDAGLWQKASLSPDISHQEKTKE